MSIRIELDEQCNPPALMLAQEGNTDGLSVQQVTYWESIRQIELMVRQYFETNVANCTILRMRNIVAEAFARGEPSNVDFERLEILRHDVVRMGTDVRNQKLRSKAILLLKFGLFTSGFVLIWIIGVSYLDDIRGRVSAFSAEVSGAINLIGVFGFGLVGLSLGAVAKSIFSNRIVSLTGLSNLDNYYFPPFLYILNLILLFTISIILLSIGVFDIYVGKYSLSSVINKPPLAFLLGIICGFAETVIVAKISHSVETRAKDISIG